MILRERFAKEATSTASVALRENHFSVLYDKICTVTQTAIRMNNALRAQWSATKMAQ